MLSRGVANTRSRDYYDVFILWALFSDRINRDTLADALHATSKQRETSHYLDNYSGILDSIKSNAELKDHWQAYQNNFPYAQEIEFSDIIATAQHILDLVQLKL